MARKLVALLFTCCFVLQSFADPPAKTASVQPNVIIIFIDDMGFGDVGFNGAQGPRTPHLDQMAKEGMQFRDFYVGCAVCSGSRTALMTGTHYQRLSMSPVLFPNSTTGLHPDEVTIADMLSEAGYATTCIGKWHLGHLPPCLPTYQGFDSYYGIPYSNDMWIDPANRLADDLVLREGVTIEQLKSGQKLKNRVPLMLDEEVIEYPVDQSTVTKRYTERAVHYIQEQKDRPFFIYLPHTMVHVPLAVSDAFKNRTGELIWDAIEEVDWSVGQILQALKDNKIDEKTLVIFTSDNGAAVGSSLPLRAKKGSVYDGGIREPTVMRWPSQIPAGTICHEVSASIDILPTLSHLCNGKLPSRQIDGRNIWPLMNGQPNAASPHSTYCLAHGPGTVRSGQWKYYPWKEGQSGRRKQNSTAVSDPQSEVQLYDTVNDIGETKNVAAHYPEVVSRLQKAWEEHLVELNANKRPTAELQRPEGSLPATRPGNKSAGTTPAGKSINWKTVKSNDTYQARSAPHLVNQPFTISCSLDVDKEEGVIVAHGGSVTGYSLYIKDDQLVFALRRSKEQIHRVSASLTGKTNIAVTATADRKELSIQIDQASPVTASHAGLLVRHPSEDLSINHDNAHPVDPESPMPNFKGTIQQLKVSAAGSKK